MEAYRKLDPITTPEGELRFLQAAEALFMKGELVLFLAYASCDSDTYLSYTGWQVGSDPEIQVATVVSNHLTAAIMKYFGDSGRYDYAANLFEKITAKEPEVASLLAKSYLGMSMWLRCFLCRPLTRHCRRGSESCPDYGFGHQANAAVIYSSPRTMRIPPLKRQTRVGTQTCTSSRQLCTKRVRNMGEAD